MERKHTAQTLVYVSQPIYMCRCILVFLSDVVRPHGPKRCRGCRPCFGLVLFFSVVFAAGGGVISSSSSWRHLDPCWCYLVYLHPFSSCPSSSFSRRNVCVCVCACDCDLVRVSVVLAFSVLFFLSRFALLSSPFLSRGFTVRSVSIFCRLPRVSLSSRTPPLLFCHTILRLRCVQVVFSGDGDCCCC